MPANSFMSETTAEDRLQSFLQEHPPQKAVKLYNGNGPADWRETAEDLAVMLRNAYADLEEARDQSDFTVLESPLSEEELNRIDRGDGHVNEVIKVELWKIADMEMEDFYDYLSNQVIGNSLLHEISYDAVEVASSHAVYLRVTGYLPE